MARVPADGPRVRTRVTRAAWLVGCSAR
jgi:hypothetical protein